MDLSALQFGLMSFPGMVEKDNAPSAEGKKKEQMNERKGSDIRVFEKQQLRSRPGPLVPPEFMQGRLAADDKIGSWSQRNAATVVEKFRVGKSLILQCAGRTDGDAGTAFGTAERIHFDAPAGRGNRPLAADILTKTAAGVQSGVVLAESGLPDDGLIDAAGKEGGEK